MVKHSITVILLSVAVVRPGTGPVKLEFSHLENTLQARSPEARLLDQRLVEFNAVKKLSLRGSAPELYLTGESLSGSGGSSDEQALAFRKSFRFPTRYLREKQIWKLRSESERLNHRGNTLMILSGARSLYVRSRLLGDFNRYSKTMEKILKNLYQDVQDRSKEGSISILEAQLLSSGLFELRAQSVNSESELKQTTSNLKLLLGIDEDLVLETEIHFREVSMDEIQLPESLTSYPVQEARLKRLEALEQNVRLARLDIIPNLTLEGGWKQIDRNLSGPTIGMSLPLPQPGLTRSRTRIATAQLETARTENDIFRKSLEAQARHQMSLIALKRDLLKQAYSENGDSSELENLLAAYREGVLTLTELLNSFQIHRQSTWQYMDQLADYYELIFELEALTGMTLIDF